MKKNLFNKIISILYIVLIIIIVFFPKINFVSVAGTYVGIRIEDILIALFAILYIIQNRKTLFAIFDNKNIKRLTILFLLYILCCVISSVLGILSGYVTIKLCLLYILRKIEYFLFIFLGINLIIQ